MERVSRELSMRLNKRLAVGSVTPRALLALLPALLVLLLLPPPPLTDRTIIIRWSWVSSS